MNHVFIQHFVNDTIVSFNNFPYIFDLLFGNNTANQGEVFNNICAPV